MNSKQWVCHISGQGEKWEIQKYQDPEWPSWVAPHTVNGGGLLYLPKSEYRLCEPPEVWKDVTGECEIACNNRDMKLKRIDIACTMLPIGYRLRKVELWQANGIDGKNCQVAAFIVEQKVTN